MYSIFLSLKHCFSKCYAWTLGGTGLLTVPKNLPSGRGKKQWDYLFHISSIYLRWKAMIFCNHIIFLTILTFLKFGHEQELSLSTLTYQCTTHLCYHVFVHFACYYLCLLSLHFVMTIVYHYIPQPNQSLESSSLYIKVVIKIVN